MTDRAPRISVFTTMPPGVYSGGRYLSMILAYSMARAGAEVNYVTNNAALFERDFAEYEARWPVRRLVTPSFDLPADMKSDWVVVIPTGSFDSKFYNAALQHARSAHARVALLSFETPNWYNAMSPYPRSPMPTEGWRQVVAGGGLVVTIADEGLEHARQYFGAEREDLAFGCWHPPINDLAADRARESLAQVAAPSSSDRRRVAMFVRTEDPHKGAHDLFSLPPGLFDGSILSLVFGRGIPQGYLDAVRHHFAPARAFAIEPLARITDEEKFRLLGESRLLLFPSRFEGFGYPPVEAAEMGVPTIAYDMPVVREVAGDAVTGVPFGDTLAFADAVAHALEGPPSNPESIRGMIRSDPGTLAAGERILTLFEKVEFVRPPGAFAPAKRIPANPLKNSPTLQLQLSRLTSQQRLVSIDTRLSARTMEIVGRVSGAEAGDRLRFRMAGARIPETIIGARQPDGTSSFSVVGIIDDWVEQQCDPAACRGTGAAQLHCSLSRAKGIVDLGFELVRPDWATLLLWPEGPSRVPAPTADLATVLIAFRPEELAADPASAALASAICETLDRLGRRTRLLLPTGGPFPNEMANADVEILPRVHEVELIEFRSLTDRVAAAVLAGDPVILASGSQVALPDNGHCLRLALEQEVQPQRDFLLISPGASAGRKVVRPNPHRSRRSLADASRHRTVVLAPRTVLNGLSPAMLQWLKQAEARYDSLEVVIADRLWDQNADPRFGIEGVVRPLSEAALTAVINGNDHCVGLIPGKGPGDGLTQDLTEISGHQLIPVREGRSPGKAVADEPRDCEVAKLFTSIFVAAARFTPLGLRGGNRLEANASPAALPVLPVLTPEAVLSFSSSVGERPNAALIQGWGLRDIFGASMTEATAVVAFELTSKPASGTQIELLFRISGETKPGPVLRVSINGNQLSSGAPVPLGTSVARFVVPESAWADFEGQQLLIIEQPKSAEKADHKIKLQAVSIGRQSVGLSTPTPSSRLPQKLAPLLVPRVLEAGTLAGSWQFGIDGTSGPLLPVRGWSTPEVHGIWSDGKTATLSFQPLPASNDGAVCITFAGEAFDRPDGDFQRMGMRIGGQQVFRDRLPVGRLATFRIVLSAQWLAAERPDHVALELPDAISPRQLGMSNDARQLAFSLQKVTIEPLFGKFAEGRLELDAGQTRTANMSCVIDGGSVIVRLRGSGPTPEGGFAIYGDTAIYTAATTGPCKWDVCLPVPKESGDRIAMGWLPTKNAKISPLPDDLVVEVWGSERPACVDEELRLSITLVSLDGDGCGFGLDTAAERDLQPKLRLPARFVADAEGDAGTLLTSGWSSAEAGGTWSDSKKAEVRIPPFATPAIIILSAKPFLPVGLEQQEVRVSDQRGSVAVVRMDDPAGDDIIIPLTAPLVGSLVLELPNASAPAQSGLSRDSRELGMFITQIDMLPAGGELASTGIPIKADGAAQIAIAAVRPIPGRPERILWLTGTGPNPGMIGTAGGKLWSYPSAREDSPGWLVGVPIGPDAGNGEELSLSCIGDDGACADLRLVLSNERSQGEQVQPLEYDCDEA